MYSAADVHFIVSVCVCVCVLLVSLNSKENRKEAIDWVTQSAGSVCLFVLFLLIIMIIDYTIPFGEQSSDIDKTGKIDR